MSQCGSKHPVQGFVLLFSASLTDGWHCAFNSGSCSQQPHLRQHHLVDAAVLPPGPYEQGHRLQSFINSLLWAFGFGKPFGPVTWCMLCVNVPFAQCSSNGHKVHTRCHRQVSGLSDYFSKDKKDVIAPCVLCWGVGVWGPFSYRIFFLIFPFPLLLRSTAFLSK